MKSDLEQAIQGRIADARAALNLPGNHQELGIEIPFRAAAIAYNKAAGELESQVTEDVSRALGAGDIMADFERSLEQAAARGIVGKQGIAAAVAALLSVQARRSAAFLRARAGDLCEEAARHEGALEALEDFAEWLAAQPARAADAPESGERATVEAPGFDASSGIVDPGLAFRQEAERLA